MKKIFLSTLLIFVIDIAQAQLWNFENDDLSGVSIMVAQSLNSCGAKKGFRSKYYFNSKEKVVRVKHSFRRQKRSKYEFRYDSFGNMTHQITKYNINQKGTIDTSLTQYKYDSLNRIVKKTHWTSPEYSFTKVYSDFTDLNKPQKVISLSSSSADSLVQILSYNLIGQVVKIEVQDNDTLRISEIRDYNEHGYLSYSIIPSIVGKEKEPLAIWVGGGRYAPEERYEYKYDRQNRWIEKYILYRDKKVLLETRKFK